MNKHIVYLGYSGFPKGYAEVQKLIMVSKSLMHAGCKVKVINRKSVLRNSDRIPAAGSFEGIDYIYTTGTSVRPPGKINNYLDSIKGIIGEVSYLFKLKKQGKLDGAILSTKSIGFVWFYTSILRFLKAKSVLNYVEYRSDSSNKNDTALDKFKLKLFLKNAFKLVDKVMPISDFLIDVIKENSPQSEYLKLPPICDFEIFKKFSRTADTNYFLFCGSIAYWELLDFILNAFEKVNNDSTELHLICGGSKKLIEKLQNRINSHPKKNLIKHFYDIPYDELVSKYVNSYAMLIPIRHTIKDIARYPHKISEYVASGRAIISTNEGEVKLQFKDGETALLAEKYDVEMFAEKLQQAVDNPELVEKISENAYRMGMEVYNYKAYFEKLKALFD